MRKYRLYLFDFDGTLVDTSKALRMVFKESYRQFDRDVTDEDCVRFSREPLNHSFQSLGLDLSRFWDFVDVINFYLNSDESVALSYAYDDLMSSHKFIKDIGAMYGIVTSNNIPHVKEILNHIHFPSDEVDVYVGNQEAPNPKPDPMSINKALEMLHYQGELSDVVYIGDSLNDCKAAENAGIETYLLDRHHEYKDVPYRIIYSLEELIIR